MEEGISIIYANRNRDSERIKISLESLQQQSTENLEVVFVDYGSNSTRIEEYRQLFQTFSFVHFYPLEVSQLLWNKSKALNYGIQKAAFSNIFIADVDLIFQPGSLSFFQELANPEKFFLFRLGYLSEAESGKLRKNYEFKDLKPHRVGSVNGMLLAAKEALLKVNGLDEFFHFYGAEDEDLFARLEHVGYTKTKVEKEIYFYHNWHKSFSGSEDKLLTGNPRIKNIMRINQRHFLRNKDLKLIKPRRQTGMGETISPARSKLLKNPSREFQIKNIEAHVEHFLREELASAKGEILQVEFVEDPYYHSLKHRIKKLTGRQTQPYISMKQVNDMLLKEILFNYRDHNYSFQIAEDLKRISFCIEL